MSVNQEAEISDIWFENYNGQIQSICEAVIVQLETIVMKIPSFIFINMSIFSPKQIN